MLGRIAIAAMGGCFSQNPDTGAAEATYFPAESVLLTGNIRYGNEFSRPAGATDFFLGFTQTRFWTKQQRVQHGNIGLVSWAVLGTQGTKSGERCWCCLFSRSIGVTYYSNEFFKLLSEKVDPTFIFTYSKQAGSNTSVAESDAVYFDMETTEKTSALANIAFDFLIGSPYAEGQTRFWGDCCQNEPYGVSWQRLPMQSAETGAAALFEIEGKQLFEY